MLEILQFYVSSFWTWAGITVGLLLVAEGLGGFARSLFYGKE